jgi:hypothetical protein
MPSYRRHRTIKIEAKKAAKEEKYIPSLAAIAAVTALAAKIKNKPGSQGLEPGEVLMRNLLEIVLLSSEFYHRPHALGPRPLK